MKYPEIQDQIARYEGFGFTKAYCNDMDKLYSWFITDADRKRIERIEYFDEYEEWHLIQGHYCILVAARGNLSEWFDNWIAKALSVCSGTIRVILPYDYSINFHSLISTDTDRHLKSYN